MGLIRFIKAAISFRKTILASIQEQQEKEALYLRMTTEELSDLSDEELLRAVVVRAEQKVDAAGGISALNEKQRIVWAVNSLDLEVNNGGICQFFVNSSREAAPWVSNSLEIIGAAEHKKLFDDFIARYGIDVNDLSSFDVETTEEFSAQYERYPFDEYDNAFCKLKPLALFLTAYIRNDTSDF